MIGLVSSKDGKLTKINKMELCDNVDTSKVKILKVLVTPEDLDTVNGTSDAEYPVIPGRVAIGQISDASETSYLTRGTRVYISPVNSCGKCTECLSDNEKDCSNFKVAGKNTDGYLRDFAVVENKNMHALPASVSNEDALLLDYIAISLSTLEKLEIKKGDHIAIIGGGILGTVMALLSIYFQAVPILVHNNEENRERASKAGIYYNFLIGNSLEQIVSERTGAHMAQKVIYLADSNINSDNAIKLSAYNAKIGFVGFNAPTMRVNFSAAMKKQLQFICITNGFGMEEQAINILANKAVDFSCFHFQSIKFDACETALKKAAKEQEDGHNRLEPIIVDMM